ncbi:MAG: MFS transporter [Gemmatimonadales bacterium]
MTTSGERWRQLALLAVVQVLGMSVWFAGSAVAPVLAAKLSLSPGESGWLLSGVQLGFVAGTLVAAVLNLPDLVPARSYLSMAALVAAAANATLLFADSFPMAIASRIATGIGLAGVYPPAMKMAATWFRQERGLAIGVVVGALTVGKAFPYLLEGAGHLPLAPAVLIPSVAAALAAILVLVGYRDGPFPFPARPFSWGLATTVVRDPALRQVTGGYLGHMWELYAFWAWVPSYLTASLAARGSPQGNVGTLAFIVVAIGGVGAVWGGRAADRIGRAPVIRRALTTSGVCCLLSAVVFGGPAWLVLSVCLIWGVAVIADSAQFSALVTERAAEHAVGTALTLQTSIGFLLTIASIQLVPVMAGWIGWRWALAVLSLGPMAGLAAIRGMRTDRA